MKLYKHLGFSIILIFILFVQFAACQPLDEIRVEVLNSELEILPAINHGHKYFEKLIGKRVGLVVNAASVINGIHLVDTLLLAGVNVTRIFTPEHGFFSNKSAGEKLSDNRYKGIAISSLYGETKKPSKKDIESIDILVFDLQDVGLRFYTYISTMHYIIEACNETNIPLIILDRPNPFINVVDGPILEKDFSSFVGKHKVPVVYGMTIGEYALMIVGEQWVDSIDNFNLQVIEMDNYNNNSYYEFPIAPSPNLPNHTAIMNYPGLCFFEGTIISVGRGTRIPFQGIGHPSLPIGMEHITPHVLESSKWPKHLNKPCNFRKIDYKSDMDSNSLDLRLLFEMNSLAKQNNIDLIDRVGHFDRIAGTDKIRSCLNDENCDFDLLRKSWAKGITQFRKIREKYLLYEREQVPTKYLVE